MACDVRQSGCEKRHTGVNNIFWISGHRAYGVEKHILDIWA
jgi:hypothetical protein